MTELPEELKQTIFNACNSCRTSIDEFMPECQKELYCIRCKEVIVVVASFIESARKELKDFCDKLRTSNQLWAQPEDETLGQIQDKIDSVLGGGEVKCYKRY